MKAYIAGPMRGIERYNFDAFDKARDWLIEKGWEPVNPADLDRSVGITGWSQKLPEGFVYDALRRDFSAIVGCDAIVFLPGWEHSSGAKAERRVGEYINLRFFQLDPETGVMSEETSIKEPPHIIGLSGYARSGKDSVAEVLVADYGFTRVAFADTLRDALYTLNPLIEVYENSPQNDRLSHIVEGIGWDDAKTQFPEIRNLLQRLGTEVGRQLLGANIWVDIVVRNIASTTGPVVITDVRFPNEFHAINDLGGQLWRVQRPGVHPANTHPSETAIDNFAWDVELTNDGTLDYLRSVVVPNALLKAQ